MCGIFGYKGDNNARNVLLTGLERLEYRWYDSAGIVVGETKENNYIKVKEIWEISNLEEEVQNQLGDSGDFNIWIAHTRWATHGRVNLENTHPHVSEDWKVFVVHNGIIENFESLKKELESQWYKFYSDTDSELLAALIQKNKGKDLLQTVENILPKLEWAYAFLVMHKDFPGQIVGMKYGSPLVFGHQDQWEFVFSSDVTALGGFADNVIFLDDWEIVFANNNDYLLKSEWKLIVKPSEKVDTESLVADKGDYQHFMLKEIEEQPQVIESIFKWRIDFDNFSINAASFQDLENYDFENIVFVGCGTSYNAGLLWCSFFENIVGMNARVEIASEYEYKNIRPDDKTLYVFISQSGETADTLQALKLIKNKWWKTFGLVNVVGSSISRETDFGLFLRAGTEVGVASTKAFTAQVMSILLMAMYFGQKKDLNLAEFENLLKNIQQLPDKVRKIIQNTYEIKEAAEHLKEYNNFFFLGRWDQLPIAYESSLKFKEISYLHSEAYAAGELKHWPLALIDENLPSIVLSPGDMFFDKNISSIEEIKARDWVVITVWDQEINNADFHINIPEIKKELYPFLTAIVGQILAYYVALYLNRAIDKPRNLAKSVTVR